MPTTIYRLNKQTGQISADVQNGQGESCRQKNAAYYDALGRQFPGMGSREEPKPEMELTEQEMLTQT